MGAFRHANNTVSAHGAAVITPSDSAVIPSCRGIWVGVAGTITVRMADFVNGGLGDNILFTVPAGLLPIQVDRVYSTGTTATGLVALY